MVHFRLTGNTVRVERVREAEKKEPFITDAGLEKIYAIEPLPFFNDIVFVGRHTGLRLSNILTMQWPQLDLSSREKGIITIEAERAESNFITIK